MRRKYGDCQREDGNCTLCSLVNYGRDCHNKAITKLEWYRLGAEMTQKALSTKSGVYIRQIQKIEAGECATENLAIKTANALADALEIDIKDLI